MYTSACHEDLLGKVDLELELRESGFVQELLRDRFPFLELCIPISERVVRDPPDQTQVG